jgi:hypothetical protein
VAGRRGGKAARCGWKAWLKGMSARAGLEGVAAKMFWRARRARLFWKAWLKGLAERLGWKVWLEGVAERLGCEACLEGVAARRGWKVWQGVAAGRCDLTLRRGGGHDFWRGFVLGLAYCQQGTGIGRSILND